MGRAVDDRECVAIPLKSACYGLKFPGSVNLPSRGFFSSTGTPANLWYANPNFAQ